MTDLLRTVDRGLMMSFEPIQLQLRASTSQWQAGTTKKKLLAQRWPLLNLIDRLQTKKNPGVGFHSKIFVSSFFSLKSDFLTPFENTRVKKKSGNALSRTKRRQRTRVELRRQSWNGLRLKSSGSISNMHLQVHYENLLEPKCTKEFIMRTLSSLILKSL